MSADHAIRSRVLDSTESFLVQAPAGSGKTSLLTQRVLKLLTVVDEPEQIIALTFTQKAAQEMRHRVMKALSLPVNYVPEDDYAQTLFDLAMAVKARDQALGWNLCEHPQRLRMLTIDAFCVMINQRLPLSSKMGGLPRLTDNPTPLYHQAIAQLLADLGQEVVWAPALERVLAHLDNRVDLFERLLLNMLEIREQWLGIVTLSRSQALSDMLEQSLQALYDHHAEQLQQLFPAHLQRHLLQGLQFAAQHIPIDIEDEEAFFGPYASLEAWKKICPLLLTQSWTLRKTVSKDQGFPAPSEKGISQDSKAERTAMKENMLELFQALAAIPRMERVLTEIHRLPPLSGAHTTDLTEAVLTLLPVLAAYCQLQFQQAGEIDFIEMALRAEQSLRMSEEEGISDISLQLDYHIRHVLVDEFQDTSRAQFRLLTSLVQGFEPGDGRTIFCVGDPMQSIYRFRKAEVGLFAEVREQGIGPLHPIFVQLSSNFRSTHRLVTTVNECFTPLAPTMEGQVQYFPAIAESAHRNASSEVNLLLCEDEIQEAEAVVKTLQAWQHESPHDKIAILVRAKQHAYAILKRLAQEKITYQAHDLEGLHDRPFAQDLLALTYALSHEADALSWYAVLRAPWAGLQLDDLLMMARSLKTCWSVWQVLQQDNVVASLSLRGQQIVGRLRPIIEQALYNKMLQPLPIVVEHAWQALGGPLVVQHEDELKDVAVFFDCLSQCVTPLGLVDRAAFEQALSAKRAAVREVTPGAIVVMTIHKSKGLEFDRVIIPSCERRTRQSEKPLLLYETVPSAQGEDFLALLSVLPMEGVSTPEEKALYYYLWATEQAKQEDELIRLLYVATTRAKSHVLFSAVQEEGQQASGACFLALLNNLPTTQNPSPTTRDYSPTSQDPQPTSHDYSITSRGLTAGPIPSRPQFSQDLRCFPATFSYPTWSFCQPASPPSEDLNLPERTGESMHAVAMGVVLHEILFTMALQPRHASAGWHPGPPILVLDPRSRPEIV